MSIVQKPEHQASSWQEHMLRKEAGSRRQLLLEPKYAAWRAEELTYRAGCLPVAGPEESDFLSSVSLAVILLLVFISVSSVLVFADAHPLPVTTCWPSAVCHRISSLARLRLLFPSQSETLWRMLELSLGNQWQLPDLPGGLRIPLAAVGLGESRNTVLCLSKNLISQLSVADQILFPAVGSKLLDFSPSELYWGPSAEVGSHLLSVSVVGMRQGHAAYGINVALHHSLAAGPAVWRTMLGLSPSSVDTVEQSWLQNVTSSIVSLLLERVGKNKRVPEGLWVMGLGPLPVLSVEPEPALERVFFC
ncbi:uncharacterized protein LOC115097977 [Rhinatrema bivittatum]|uniref:uncharacterized protein LOC115097977 n=1 Tax=Rhinatrema bivittatum TaxID=194408 RepID=UPI0011278D06|nr:uncharacterized protein LOC115097977 [Rhinatrema bivittatum]XP_029470060.1 uncharacterized protein LOC115097977 [Rhinatrema bivittatum]XP_029470061.1 uncharacterized protein LOC115097977 [Rhinatrema bivittatum]